MKIPAGTKLAAGGFYLLGLSNSGLAVPAGAGDTTINVRSTTGMSVGNTLSIGAGSSAETRKIAKLGTAATNPTTVWQPLPDGPVITIPVGSTNVPVMSTVGFAVGQKIAIGYGATYPAVAQGMEKYEVATVTAVGKSGTQAYLGADAPVGATNIKVTSVSEISVGDKIRLDIDSTGHGIETVTVTHVGTQATHTNLSANADSGATSIKVRSANGFAVGDKVAVGTPANLETVTITAVGKPDLNGAGLDFTPALSKAHIRDEGVRRSRHGPRSRCPAQVHARGQPPLQRSRNGNQFPAGNSLCPLQQRARPGARHRHHARQPSGQRPSNRVSGP